MKKTIAILLVAILAASSVFAAFSGSAQVGLGANFDNGDWGFIGNETSVTFDLDFATANAEAVSDGDIYASIKAALGLRFVSDQDGTATGNPYLGYFRQNGEVVMRPYAKIDEAKVGSANWYVSLKGLPDVNDFAKSAIDTWTAKNDFDDDWDFLKADYDKNATYKVGYDKAPGVEVGIYDFVIGVGFKANAVQEPKLDLLNESALTLFARTPEFAILDGLTVQAGLSYTNQDAKFIDNDDKEINAFGGSAKIAYTSDFLTASIATDMGYDLVAEEFGADVAANVGFDFITADFYYATSAANSGVDGDPEKNVDYKDGDKVEDLLSLQAALDLTAFNAPVKLTLTGKDLINAQDLSATVDLIFGGFTVSPTVGYVIDTETFKAGVAAEYTCDYFTAKAEANIKTAFEKDDLVMDASASIENSTLIPGTTIKLAWSDAKDLLDNDASETSDFGKIIASLKVEF